MNITRDSSFELETVSKMHLNNEMSGSAIHIYLANGGVLVVAPDNDIVCFFKSVAEYEDGQQPDAILAADMGAGMDLDIRFGRKVNGELVDVT